MQISNDDLARILGRIESKLDAQAATTTRVEGGLATLDQKVSLRLDEHDQRLRELEIANPKQMTTTLHEHEERIQTLERNAAKAGAIAGVGSSLAVAALVELLKGKLGW
jgi:hypothetical protein